MPTCASPSDSISASVMFVGIALITAVRDQNTLACIFFLVRTAAHFAHYGMHSPDPFSCCQQSFTTMWCGFLTEMHSRPATVVGPDGKLLWDKTRWEGDPKWEDYWEKNKPIPPIVDSNGFTSAEYKDYKAISNKYTYAKFKNYSWRMAPHVLGFFPYITAWVIILNNFAEQVADLPSDIKIPAFVVAIIAGSVAIFSVFTFVRYPTLKQPRPIYLTSRFFHHRCKSGTSGSRHTCTGSAQAILT